jgi:rRNA (uridine-N3-)-methyltransferase BTM5-like
MFERAAPERQARRPDVETGRPRQVSMTRRARGGAPVRQTSTGLPAPGQQIADFGEPRTTRIQRTAAPTAARRPQSGPVTRIHRAPHDVIRRAPRLIRGQTGRYFDADTNTYYQSEFLGWAPPSTTAAVDPDVYVGDYFDETGTKKLNDPKTRLRRIKDVTNSLYLVGEGDFSYAAGIAAAQPTTQVSATSYDPGDRVIQYPSGKQNMENVKARHGSVLHGVNAMALEKTASPPKVDVLQWNFPHSGAGSGTDRESPEFEVFVKSNRELLTGFFASAHHKVADGGLVKLTYKKISPYTEWNVDQLAAQQGWEMVDEKAFAAPAGYKHVLTKDTQGTVKDTGAVTVTYRPAPGAEPRIGVPADLVASKLDALQQIGELKEGKEVEDEGSGEDVSEIKTPGKSVRPPAPDAVAEQKSTPPRITSPTSTVAGPRPAASQKAARPSGAGIPFTLTFVDATVKTVKKSAKGSFGFAKVKGRPNDVFIPGRLLGTRTEGAKVEIVIARGEDGKDYVSKLRDKG